MKTINNLNQTKKSTMLRYFNFKKLTAKTLITILVASTLVAQSSTKKAVADNTNNSTITVTIEAPTIQSSQLPNSNYYVVDFNDGSGTAGFSKTNNGTTYQYGGDLNVKIRDQWGGASGSNYITQADGKTSYNLKVSQDQRYFGFWWSAGDPANKIIFKNDGQEIAVFKTEDLVSFINSSGVNDSSAYYGNPNGGYGKKNTGHLAEPFAYVNVFFNDKVFDEVVVQTTTTSGAKFESDNHTFSATKQAVRGLVVQGTIPDTDDDGLKDNVDPNPTNPDVDDDGILDGNDPYPTDPDHDKDGLKDGIDPNPNKADTDGDGLKDGEEVNGNPATDPTKADTDGDGINDKEDPYPTNPDGDGDGLKDGEEVNGNPATDPTKADTDGDGLSDKTELTATPPTNPTKKDTDGDGLNDNDPREADPTKADTDGDGYNDKVESEADYKSPSGADVDSTKLKNPKTITDIDGDGTPNNKDTDTDGDGYPDITDRNPAIPDNPD
jgi:hypothetical protein